MTSGERIYLHRCLSCDASNPSTHWRLTDADECFACGSRLRFNLARMIEEKQRHGAGRRMQSPATWRKDAGRTPAERIELVLEAYPQKLSAKQLAHLTDCSSRQVASALQRQTAAMNWQRHKTPGDREPRWSHPKHKIES